MTNKPATPYFVLNEAKLLENLAICKTFTQDTGIQWLYTLKAFDAPEGIAIIQENFHGFSIGNIEEYKKLSRDINSHIHSYAPAYHAHEVEKLAHYSHTMSFNSISQWQRYHMLCAPHSSLGLRINPKLILQQPKYCDTNISRLGVPSETFLELYATNPILFKHLEGLHFHALCGQNFLALDKLLTHIEKYYTSLLPKLKWLNLGGGQNFTDPNYTQKAFMEKIQQFSSRYPHIRLYFEPGTAIVYHAGTFVTSILDIIDGAIPTLILDTSIETHLLDIAITKQQPHIQDTSLATTDYPYQVTGMSCIAGDDIGTYYFQKILNIGDTIIFEDMLGYSFVKQTNFNGSIKAKCYIRKTSNTLNLL